MAERLKRKSRDRVKRKSKTHKLLEKSSKQLKEEAKIKFDLASSLTSFVQVEDTEFERERFLRHVADRINMDLGRQVIFKDKSLMTFDVVGRVTFPTDMLRFDQCWPHTSVDAAKITLGKGGLRSITLATYKNPTPHKWSVYLWNIDDRSNKNE